MSNFSSKLISRWIAQDVTVRRGCPSNGFDAFEAREGHELPSDLREFLALANGVESDGNGFSFWQLENYELFDRQIKTYSPGAPGVDGAEDYYVFCDYLDWSWAYAIRLNVIGSTIKRLNDIVPVGMNQMYVVASSFSEFMDLYMCDSPKLYPP